MKFFAISSLLLAFLQVRQTPSGIIEGVVTRTDGRTPLSGVLVEIEEGFPSSRLGMPFSAETTTDGGGRFIIRNVPAGEFTLTASLDGYLGRVAGKAGELSHATVFLNAGQRVRVALELTAISTIRGRVSDGEDRPAASVNVEILQQQSDDLGNRSWSQVSDSYTNDNGEYQIRLVPPGTYYVRTKNYADLEAKAAYFPGTADPDAALPITVPEGVQVLADIRIPQTDDTATFKVSGRLVHSFTGFDPGDPSLPPGLSLIRRDRTSLENDVISGRADAATGRFEIPRVPPGAYDLLATINVGGDYYEAQVPVDVRDRDIEDVTVNVSRGMDVRAHLVVDGDPQDFVFVRTYGIPAPGNEAAGIRVTLRGKDLRVGPHWSVDEEGTEITFLHVPDGTYAVSVGIEPLRARLNPDFYVDDVRVAGRSVYDSGLRVGLDPVDSVEIVIGTRGGSIEGTIPQKGKTAAIVILIPDTFRRNNPALYKREIVRSSDEKFRLEGIAPGNYRIFAVPDTGESLPFRSPGFAARYESRALPVTIQKGATVGATQVPLLSLDR
jgi:hypothetical protein